MTSVEINPGQLRTAAADCDRIHGAINDALTQLQSVLNAKGKPWGDDSFGHKFANGDKGYIAVSQNLLSGIGDLAGTFGSFASGQRQAADELSAADTGNPTQ